MNITVGEEKIVTMSPAYPKDSLGVATVEWGPYEFPKIGRHPDGRLFVKWHMAADHVSAFGTPGGWAVSEDNGETWKPFDLASEPTINAVMGTRMPNGEYIQYYVPTNTPLDEETYEKLSKLILVDELEAPAPFEFKRVAVNDVPDEYICKNYRYWVTCDNVTKVELREADTSDFPHKTVHLIPEALANPTPFLRPKLAPDGSLWQPLFQKAYDATTGVYSRRHAVYFLRSTDNGKSFQYMSKIIHKLDFDPEWDLIKEGFSEPDIEFMPDGSMITLLRTGFFTPSYICRSVDGGHTWSEPVEFDYCGTYPQLRSLPNGITVASYGRPGLYVRFTDDPSGMKWEDPIEIIPRLHGKDFWDLETKVNDTSCFNPEIIPINDHELILVYSYSKYKDSEGFIHKSIRCRKISVEV